MKTFCDIYKSSKDQELYVYIKFGEGLDSLPETLLERLGKPSKVMSLELTPERKLARVDVNKVIEAIHSKGFFLQLPPSSFEAPSD